MHEQYLRTKFWQVRVCQQCFSNNLEPNQQTPEGESYIFCANEFQSDRLALHATGHDGMMKRGTQMVEDGAECSMESVVRQEGGDAGVVDEVQVRAEMGECSGSWAVVNSGRIDAMV